MLEKVNKTTFKFKVTGKEEWFYKEKDYITFKKPKYKTKKKKPKTSNRDLVPIWYRVPRNSDY